MVTAEERGIEEIQRRLRAPWDVVVVGGGPAAALQVRAKSPGMHVLVVSPSLGGGMEMLGRQRMQSYVDELSVTSLALPLRRYTELGAVRPTGAQYARYVRDAIRTSRVDVLPLTVADVWPECGVLKIAVHDRHGVSIVVAARSVVLATGCRPRGLPLACPVTRVLSHDTVYRDLNAGELDTYRGRPILIVGSGNTAMQLAAGLTAVSPDVTVLATKYWGMFPQETDDRFAWRAASQLTCELVAKTALRSSVCHADDAAVRFIIYDELSVSAAGTIQFSYCATRNRNPLGHYSLPPYHPTLSRFRSDLGGHRWLEWRLSDAVLIGAIGVKPVYPEGQTLKTLKRDSRGYIHHSEGRTAMPGLFLSGICAGFPAVNFMKIPQIDPIEPMPGPVIGVSA